LLLARK